MAAQDEMAVDPVRLAAWMDTQGLGHGVIEAPALLTGGTQNILLRYSRSGRDYVLRRPPPGRGPQADMGMVREARVLSALAGTAVPHARLIALCADPKVLGAAFYLMEPVDGFNPSGRPLPVPHADDPLMRRAMGHAAVDSLLRLGEVDIDGAGLAGFGRPEGFLQRQVPRWRQQLAGYADLAGWPGPQGLPGVDALGAWLESHRPTDSRPGILHGDYHLSNLMFSSRGPQVAAIVDWELATLGDPLLDLGWLLATWPDASGQGAGTIHVTPWTGFPTREELIAHYAAHSRRDLTHIEWYAALAAYKLGILLEGSHARSCAGKAPEAVGDQHHASATRLIRDALTRVA